MNNENYQKKYCELDNAIEYERVPYPFKKPMHYHYGHQWSKWPGMYNPGGFYGGGIGWPWILLALKSLSPRDLLRFIEEAEGYENMD